MQDHGTEKAVRVPVENPSSIVALMTHFVLRDARDERRILPSYPDDNYVSLLTGEKREICIRCPADAAASVMQVTVDGWNLTPTVWPVASAR